MKLINVRSIKTKFNVRSIKTKFNVRSIKTKLVVGFLVIAMFVGAIGLLGTSNMRKINNDSKILYNENLLNIDDLHMIKSNLQQVTINLQYIAKEEDKEKTEKLVKQIEEITLTNQEIMDRFENRKMSDESRTTWEGIKNDIEHYRGRRQQIIGNLGYGDLDTRYAAIRTLAAFIEEMFEKINHLISLNQEMARLRNEDNAKAYKAASISMYTILIISIALAIFFGLFLSSGIAKAVNKGLDFAEALGDGDLRFDMIESKSEDELGKLIRALKGAQDKIKETIIQINSESGDVSASAEELSATLEELNSTFEDMSNNSTGIATSMEEINAAIEELTATIQQVNSGVTQLASSSQVGNAESMKIKERAKAIKKQGQESKNEADRLLSEKGQDIIKAIEEGKVVNEISVIAESISSIASQTNLLALNAAIEAARAGETGRGFAVVADEIRKLAEQSEKYVTEIQRVVSNVEAAFDNLSNNSKDTLDFMNERVSKDYDLLIQTGVNYEKDAGLFNNLSQETADMAQQLNTSTEEIASVIQNLACNMNEATSNSQEIINGIRQTLGALEQIAASANHQAETAENLNDLIRIFKI